MEVKIKKTIKLDGKEYILKSEVDEKYVLKAKAKNYKTFDPDIHITDAASVMGLGSVKINSDWRGVKVNLQYLKKAINIIEQVDRDKNYGVILCIHKDYPLLIGDYKNGAFGGVIIATMEMEDE